MLVPVVAPYRDAEVKHYFRGDAAVARPEICKFLGEENYLYAIRIPANEMLEREIARLLTAPRGTAAEEACDTVRWVPVPGRKLVRASSYCGQGRVALRRATAPRGLHRHEHPEASG